MSKRRRAMRKNAQPEDFGVARIRGDDCPHCQACHIVYVPYPITTTPVPSPSWWQSPLTTSPTITFTSDSASTKDWRLA